MFYGLEDAVELHITRRNLDCSNNWPTPRDRTRRMGLDVGSEPVNSASLNDAHLIMVIVLSLFRFSEISFVRPSLSHH